MALTYNGLWRYNPGNIVKAKQFYRFLYRCTYVLVEAVLYPKLKIAIKKLKLYTSNVTLGNVNSVIIKKKAPIFAQ